MALTGIVLPPDSTGKKVYTTLIIEMYYDTGVISGFARDRVIYGTTSGAKGIVSHVDSISTSVSGRLHAIMFHESPNFQDNELIRYDSGTGTIIASVNGTPTTANAQNIVQSGGNNHTYLQYVDKEGAAHTRFTSGAPQFDAFGNLRTSEGNILGGFNTATRVMSGTTSNSFSAETVGAGSGTYYPLQAKEVLSVGASDGDSMTFASNRHYNYTPGQSFSSEMTVWMGDSGKANNIRRWGMMTRLNGYFFALSGSDFGVVRRSSASGATVETFISQSAFNTDRVDGSDKISNVSQFNLDITKINLYWTDSQWLGAGTARMGVYGGDGERITMHSFYNSNVRSEPHVANPNTPICFEIQNNGGTAGASDMSVTCGVVKTEGPERLEGQTPSIPQSYVFTTKTAAVGSETILFGLTAAHKIDGQINRKLCLPESVELFATQPIILRGYLVGEGTNSNFFQPTPNSTADIDVSATAITQPFLSYSKFISANTAEQFTADGDFSAEALALIRTAFGNTGSIMYVTAEPITATPADVDYSVKWMNRELI
tara:strand:- start:352 stop:1983 length:1632 start_codon:yes stop_codon:yes gene_type:complete